MLLTAAQMIASEQNAFASGVTPANLMEKVGALMARAILQFAPEPGICIAFLGKGHNAGDALVAARHLAAAGWTLRLRLAYPPETLATLTRQKLADLADHAIRLQDTAPSDLDRAGRPLIILDGLLGLGTKGELRPPLSEAVHEINALRRREHALVFALDLPSGLDPTTGQPGPHTVTADFTLTVAHPKTGLVADRATDHVGRIALIPVPELSLPNSASPDRLATAAHLSKLLPPRRFDTHKGHYGHVALIAGSRGLTGAAILAASGALRAGAGLVTLIATDDTYDLLASACPPEVMVRPVKSLEPLLDERFDVIAAGPGLGRRTRDDLLRLIAAWPRPMVLDADALNLLAHHPDLLLRPVGPRLLTPHPGEMDRLAPRPPGVPRPPRRETATQFVARHPVTLLLKGARTLVAEAGRPLSYNTTGHPGMATGGMGDLLTGVCAALIAQGLNPRQSATLAAWLCGRASEIALSRSAHTPSTLLPTDTLAHLPHAFTDLHRHAF